jgi:hypothetical protein
MTKAVIGLAVSVLLAGFMIASAIERNAPRYSMFEGRALGTVRLDLQTGALVHCESKTNGLGALLSVGCN